MPSITTSPKGFARVRFGSDEIDAFRAVTPGSTIPAGHSIVVVLAPDGEWVCDIEVYAPPPTPPRLVGAGTTRRSVDTSGPGWSEIAQRARDAARKS